MCIKGKWSVVIVTSKACCSSITVEIYISMELNRIALNYRLYSPMALQCLWCPQPSITKRMSGVVSWWGISWWVSECVCVCVCVCVWELTGVELTVLSQSLRLLVEFISGVEGSVAVEVDTGGKVHHQHGEGGDLLHDKLVFSKRAVMFAAERVRKTVQATADLG